MTYTATIQNVMKRDDEIIIDVEYTDGIKTFTKIYPWVHMVDINTRFDQTVQNELKRINDLETGYVALKTRIGETMLQSVEQV